MTLKSCGSAEQLGGFLFVTPELRDAPLDSAAVFRVLVLDDAHRHPVDDEYHIRPVALARRRLQLPFPGDVKRVVGWRLEIDQLDVAVTLLGFVVPLPFAAQPRQHFAVALDRRRDRLQFLDELADRIGRQPRIEPREHGFQLVAEQHACLAAALLLGDLGRDRSPTDRSGMRHHRELH
jgi:hypothetical protein